MRQLAKPFTVDVSNGKGHGPGGSAYFKGYDILVQAVATGDLTGDDKPEAAVLLSCAPQPSNFFVQDVQVFTEGPQLLGQLPKLSPLQNGLNLTPLFDPNQFLIRSGQLVTSVEYYSATDSHASGPSIHRTLTWQWDGSQFTAQQEGGSSTSPEKTTGGSSSEESAVEDAIRGHYAAIGAGDFEKAYSYFGPTLRSQVPEQGWIDSHKAEQIKGTTINSLKVNSVSGEKANTTVDVTSQDKTGSSRFLLTWDLVKEDGQWKLDNQVTGQQIG